MGTSGEHEKSKYYCGTVCYSKYNNILQKHGMVVKYLKNYIFYWPLAKKIPFNLYKNHLPLEIF